MSHEINPASDGKEKNEVQVGEEGRVLASGFDTLVLALSITWRHDGFFRQLDKLKADAIAQGAPMPGVIECPGDAWLFNLKPHGTDGYAFLLSGHDYHIKFVRSTFAGARPSRHGGNSLGDAVAPGTPQGR